MGIVYNTKVINNGQTVHLDPHNVKSNTGTSTWNDLSGNNRNAAIAVTDGIANVNLGSSGDTSNYFTIPSTALQGLTTYTLDMWLRRDATNTIDVFLTCGAGNDFLWMFRNSTSTLQLEWVGATTANWNWVPTNGEWFNFVATGNNGTVTVYRN